MTAAVASSGSVSRVVLADGIPMSALVLSFAEECALAREYASSSA